MSYLSLEKDRTVPYGYYHLLIIYEDGSWWPVGYLNIDIPNVVEVAEVIARQYQLKLVNNLNQWPGMVIK